MVFPDSSVGKESACSAGDPDSVSGLGRSPGEGKGYPVQYSGLENSMKCIVNGVTKSWTRLRGFHFHFNTLSVSTTLGITVLVGAGRSGEMDRRKLGSRWEKKRKMWVVLDCRQAPGWSLSKQPDGLAQWVVQFTAYASDHTPHHLTHHRVQPSFGMEGSSIFWISQRPMK